MVKDGRWSSLQFVYHNMDRSWEMFMSAGTTCEEAVEVTVKAWGSSGIRALLEGRICTPEPYRGQYVERRATSFRMSPEHRAKISAAMRQRWADRRANGSQKQSDRQSRQG